MKELQPNIRSNALLGSIPDDLLRQAQINPAEITVKPNVVIFDENDAPDFCYLVLAGAVRIIKPQLTGREELLAVVRPGEFFGEMALYDSAPRSARAVTAVETHLARIDQEAFSRLRRIAPLHVQTLLADRSIARVRYTNERLIERIEAIGQLSEIGSALSVLSHNLRSPFATIRMTADLLRTFVEGEQHTPEDLLRFLAIIQRTADEALESIDQLMARLRGEHNPRALVTPEELLRALREQTQAWITRPGIEYSDDAGSYRGTLNVDRTEMVAALSNLVKNAVEALPPEGGKVSVIIKDAGTDIVFELSDTGRGIAEEHLPHLFDAEFTHGKQGGTGMGLHHVRSVVQEHGGEIEVSSEVGKGSQFILRLPKAPS